MNVALSNLAPRFLDPLNPQDQELRLEDFGLVVAQLLLRKFINLPELLFGTLYGLLEARDFTSGGKSVTVVDCWRVLSSKLANQPCITYVPVGRSTDHAKNADRLAELWAKA